MPVMCVVVGAIGYFALSATTGCPVRILTRPTPSIDITIRTNPYVGTAKARPDSRTPRRFMTASSAMSPMLIGTSYGDSDGNAETRCCRRRPPPTRRRSARSRRAARSPPPAPRRDRGSRGSPRRRRRRRGRRGRSGGTTRPRSREATRRRRRPTRRGAAARRRRAPRTSTISWVAYATEDSGSEQNTGSARRLGRSVSPSRSEPIGRPTSHRFAMSNTIPLQRRPAVGSTRADGALMPAYRILTKS